MRSEPTPRLGLPPVAVGVLVLIGTFLSYQVLGSLLTVLLTGTDVTAANVQLMRATTIVSQIVFLALPAVLAVVAVGWRLPETLRLRMPSLRTAVVAVVAIMVLQWALQGYLQTQNWILERYLLPEWARLALHWFDDLVNKLYAELMVMRSPVEGAFVWLTVALTPAVCEEVVFRGVVQRSFERGMRLRWAFLLTGVTFGLFHLHPMNVIVLSVIGVVLSVAVWRSGSIVLGMLMHLANNTQAVIETAVSGPAAASAPAPVAPTADVIALTLAALAAFIACAVLFWKWTHPEPTPTTQP